MTKGIGIIGGGVVGAGVVQLLLDRRESLERAGGPYEVIGVAVRDRTKPRHDVPPELLTTPEALLADARLDVLVEVAGGVDSAFGWVHAALRLGKRVVTANKAMLAERAVDLHALSREHGGALFVEAAVAGGVPIVQALSSGLVANRVVRIEGILNGTCNYIISRMERAGISFAVALAEAQAAGFAEADPTLDVSGVDTAHKLAVLAQIALERPVGASDVYTEGIEMLTPFDLAWADTNGYRVKLLGVGRFDDAGVELRVHPTLVRKERLLSQVMDEFNAVEVEGDLTGPQMYYGRGAGRAPTASAVVSDIVRALRGEGDVRARPRRRGTDRLVPMGDVELCHYLHVEVVDQPGVVAQLATVLAERGISIASMFQPASAPGSRVPVVMTTHPAPDAHVRDALARMRSGAFLANEPVHIRFDL